MIDNEEADDKIIAVLNNDPIWGCAQDIVDIQRSLIERIRHYFLTYKLNPDTETNIEIPLVYGVEHAHRVICAAIEDYREEYGD